MALMIKRKRYLILIIYLFIIITICCSYKKNDFKVEKINSNITCKVREFKINKLGFEYQNYAKQKAILKKLKVLPKRQEYLSFCTAVRVFQIMIFKKRLRPVSLLFTSVRNCVWHIGERFKNCLAIFSPIIPMKSSLLKLWHLLSLPFKKLLPKNSIFSVNILEYSTCFFVKIGYNTS